MNLFGVIAFFIHLLNLSSGEIVSLTSKNHFLCLTNDFFSAIYMEPPMVEEAKNTSVLIENDELWGSDWSLVSSQEVPVPALLAKRWEDFACTYTDYFLFKKIKNLPYSTTATNTFVKISDPGSNVTNRPTLSNGTRATLTGWGYATQRGANFSVVQLEIGSTPEAYWKIHDYKLRWATKPSHDSTQIVVDLPEVSCLMLYVFIGSNCSMTISVPGHSYTFMAGTQDDNWRIIKVELEPSTILRFSRTTTNENKEGTWGIDIRRCPKTTANTTIFERQFQNNDADIERTCKILLPKPDETYPKQTQSSKSSDIFSCSPGLFGQDCNLSCEEFLGSDLKYCEQYRICDNSFVDSKCLCSWGFEGPFCNQTCSEGSWGLSCQKSCSGCQKCNIKTGDCNSSSFSNFERGTATILSLLTFLGLLTLSY